MEIKLSPKWKQFGHGLKVDLFRISPKSWLEIVFPEIKLSTKWKQFGHQWKQFEQALFPNYFHGNSLGNTLFPVKLFGAEKSHVLEHFPLQNVQKGLKIFAPAARYIFFRPNYFHGNRCAETISGNSLSTLNGNSLDTVLKLTFFGFPQNLGWKQFFPEIVESKMEIVWTQK